VTKHMYYAAIIVLAIAETMSGDAGKASIPLLGKLPTMFPQTSGGLLAGGLGGMFGGGNSAAP